MGLWSAGAHYPPVGVEVGLRLGPVVLLPSAGAARSPLRMVEVGPQPGLVPRVRPLVAHCPPFETEVGLRSGPGVPLTSAGVTHGPPRVAEVGSQPDLGRSSAVASRLPPRAHPGASESGGIPDPVPESALGGVHPRVGTPQRQWVYPPGPPTPNSPSSARLGLGRKTALQTNGDQFHAEAWIGQKKSS